MALVLELGILGPLEVRVDGGLPVALGGPRQRASLALLALNANKVVGVDWLVDELWGESPPPTAVHTIRVFVSRLRAALGAAGGRLATRPPGYLLEVGIDEIDASRCEHLYRAGRAALAGGDARRAVPLLRDAQALWRGAALTDFAYERFAQAEIARLDELRVNCREELIEAQLALDEHAVVVRELEGLVREHPFRERPRGQLMLALYRCGRQADALDAFQQGRHKLLDELAIEPSPALRELEHAILSQDPSLSAPTPERVTPSDAARAATAEDEVVDGAETAAEPEPPPLPPALRSLAGPPYVGRDKEQQYAERAIRDVTTGWRRIVVIGGEPGIGKTRLAARVALEAHERGFCVGWATAREGLGAPYVVWSTLLSQLVEHAPRPVVQQIASRQGGELVRIIPSLPEHVDHLSEPRQSDPETERFMMFQAVIAMLEAMAGVFPIALVFDDVQWADAPSMELLQHVAAATGHLPLLLITTNRGSAVHGPRALRDALGAFHRLDGVEQLLLEGLELGEITELMSAIAGRELDGAERTVAEYITAETDGNPFFVVQILRNLAERGFIVQDQDGQWSVRGSGRVPLPPGVREVVAARVGRLGEGAEAVLEVASVIGEAFDLRVLERIVGADEHDILETLEAAVRASLLAESTEEVGRFSFAHALFKHSLYEQVGTTRRAEIHRRVAEAIEEVGAFTPDELVTELAHHWTLVPSEPRKAVHYAQLAGEQALARLAPDHAVRWFSVALGVVSSVPDHDARRCDLLIGLGEAMRQVGDPSFRQHLLDASALADQLGDLERLARSVLANTLGPYGAAGRPDPERIAVLEHASNRLAHDAPHLPLVLAIRAKEVYYGGGGGGELVERALSLARQRSGRRELAKVLSYVANIGRVVPLEHHDALVGELTQIAKELADPELQFRGTYLRFIHAMHAGDRKALDGALAEMLRLADAIGQPVLRWTALWCQSAQHWIAGDLGASETLTNEAAAMAVRHAIPQGMLVTFGQLVAIRTEQDQLEELEEPLLRQSEDAPDLRLLHVTRGFVAAQRGELGEAAAALEELASDGFRFEFHQTRAFNLARCADIALRVRALDAAAALYPILLDQRPLFATTAGVSTRGSVELNLGRLASALGRYRTADNHFTEAMSAHARLAAPLLTARTHLAIGESLLARGTQAKWADARQALLAAAKLGREHGSRAIEREAKTLLAENPEPAPQRGGG